MEKRALVTGGCGFIGSNLTKELVKQGWMVDIVDDMSNGHLELLEGLKFRAIPSSEFLTEFNKQAGRERDTVVVIVVDAEGGGTLPQQGTCLFTARLCTGAGKEENKESCK